MIKKVTSHGKVQGKLHAYKKSKASKALRRHKLEQAPDTFEHVAKSNTTKVKKRPYPSDCDNLEFKVEKIKFYDEDIKKMESMNIDEEIAYKRMLKQEKKYIVLETPED